MHITVRLNLIQEPGTIRTNLQLYSLNNQEGRRRRARAREENNNTYSKYERARIREEKRQQQKQ